MERTARSKLNTQIYEEACEWFIEFRGGEVEAAARRAFDRWLRKSPEHVSAYLEVAGIWNEGSSLDRAQKWDAQTLIAQAAAESVNVVPLAGASAAQAEPAAARSKETAERRPKFGRLQIAASIVVASLLAGTLLWSQFFRTPTYATEVGEQRSIALADGSTVELNSRSRIEVLYSEHERGIELLEGQALFRVAKDRARPFIVSTDATRVRAVGTEFDVYRRRAATIVTVIEGRVMAQSRTPDSDGSGINAQGRTPIILSAGEQVTVTPTRMQKVAHPNVATATAWTQRQLVFEHASLSEVAEEFNRYNERPLVIQDPELYDFHLSGVFSSTDPASLIRFLRERPGVHVIETTTEILVVKNR